MSPPTFAGLPGIELAQSNGGRINSSIAGIKAVKSGKESSRSQGALIGFSNSTPNDVLKLKVIPLTTNQ
ncbi:MAG: hypothetical protein ABSE82_02665 [Nitrososphaerales archaeon]